MMRTALLFLALGAADFQAALTVKAIAAGRVHSLAVKGDGTVRAWGDDEFGELGDGMTLRQSTPVKVIAPGWPDLAIAKIHQGDFRVPGQGTYTLIVTNTGLAATAGTVRVTDTLPQGLLYISAAGNGWSCWAAEPTVTCTIPDPVTPGASSTITLTVAAGPLAWPGVTNIAVVSNESDRNVSNNVIGDPTVVLQ